MFTIPPLLRRTATLFLPVLLLCLVLSPAPSAAQDAAPDSVAGTAADPVREPAVGAMAIEVAQAAICTAVEEREPVGVAESFPASIDRLYCFTDLRGAEGETVVHAWIHEGTTRARVELTARADRWRTWSSKQILPAWTGQWEVKVLTAEGAVLHTSSFTVE